MDRSRRHLPRQFVPCVLFLLALLPRITSLNAFVTWDEPVWVFRSIKFATALSQRDWTGTFLTGHPGVTTMWAGSLGLWLGRLLFHAPDQASWAAIAKLSSVEPHHTETLRQLGAWLPTARVPIAVLTALAIVAFYALVKRLFGPRVALHQRVERYDGKGR